MGDFNLINTTQTNLEEIFKNSGICENSEKAYINQVKKYKTFLVMMEKQENEISLKEYFTSIKGLLASETINLAVKALKKYYRQIFSNDLNSLFLLEQVFKSKEIKAAKTKSENKVLEDDYLSKDELFNLAEKAPERLELIIKSLFYTGCRISELLGIRLNDVKLNGKAIIRVKGKGSKERTVFIPHVIYQRIYKLCKSEVFLFESNKHTKLDRFNVSRAIHKLGLENNYDIHSHTVRHSTGMYLKQKRHLSPDQVAKYLGHNLIICLQYYFHGSPSAEDLGIL